MDQLVLGFCFIFCFGSGLQGSDYKVLPQLCLHLTAAAFVNLTGRGHDDRRKAVRGR